MIPGLSRAAVAAVSRRQESHQIRHEKDLTRIERWPCAPEQHTVARLALHQGTPLWRGRHVDTSGRGADTEAPRDGLEPADHCPRIGVLPANGAAVPAAGRLTNGLSLKLSIGPAYTSFREATAITHSTEINYAPKPLLAQ